MRISTNELLIVLAIILIIFGPTQIPKLFKMFKKSAKSLKDGLEDEDSEKEKKDSEKEA